MRVWARDVLWSCLAKFSRASCASCYLAPTKKIGGTMRLLTITILLAAAAVVHADDHVFRNTDVFELEFATDPQISPDGSRIAYVRNSMDIMSDRALPSIWIVDSTGDDHRPLRPGSHQASSPRWSPDGDRLAFVTKVRGRGSQIHVQWLDMDRPQCSAMCATIRRPSHGHPTVNNWHSRCS